MDGRQKGEASIIGKGIMEGLNMTYSPTGLQGFCMETVVLARYLCSTMFHIHQTVETSVNDVSKAVTPPKIGFGALNLGDVAPISRPNHQTKRPQNVHSMLFQSSSCRVWGWDMFFPFEICRIFQVKQILQSAAATQQRDLLFLEVQMGRWLTDVYPIRLEWPTKKVGLGI